ncbi:IS200/IS605 family transposase [Streptomyces sp. NPDC005132]|uniref:IS200/IS605 family transposase n=1 Tax=Streptomyces sp. NPDC005132 TaxID=3154294 RepID=UPI0033A72CCA
MLRSGMVRVVHEQVDVIAFAVELPAGEGDPFVVPTTSTARPCVRSPSTNPQGQLVGSLKGVSARRLRQEFPGHIRTYLWGEHFWSPSYFAASCGGAPLAVIKEYIENQKRPG